MKWGYFGDILEIKNGRNQRQVEDPNGQYPIYGSGGIMGYATQYLCEGETVVIGRKGNINKPIYVEVPFWNVDTAFGLLANKNKLFPKYLYYFCEKFNFEQLNTTVTIPSLTKANLKEIKIPLPPLEEQKRIAAILDKAHSIRQKRRQNMDNADALIKSIFLDMFGDPVTNPMGWETISLEDAYEIIDGDRGVNYPKQEDFSDTGYCLFLNTGNVTQAGFNFNKVQFISEEKNNKLRKGKLQRGDIVLTTRGTVGNTAYFSEEVPFDTMRINSGMVILRSKNILNPYFFLNLFAFKSVYRKLMSGTAQPQLPISSLKDAKIIIPKNLQNKFAEMITKIETQKAKQKEQLHEAEQIFKALQQEFFG